MSGDKYRIVKTLPVTIDGDVIECYDDNIGDEVILNGNGYVADGVFYSTNLTKGYNMYVHCEVLEKI